MEEHIARKLHKKRTGILSRYNKLKENWFVRIRKRWLTTIKTDCSKNKEYYLRQIDMAHSIIDKCRKEYPNIFVW